MITAIQHFLNNPPFAVLALIIGIFSLLGLRGRKVNRWRVRTSHDVLVTLGEIGKSKGFASQIKFLRSLKDPFLFEEMILSAIEKKGHKIQRNKRYTGDGGIDGRAFLNGRLILIQAKKYTGKIITADLARFIKQCEEQKAIGLFVHTGTTPKPAFKLCEGREVEIVSGVKLIELLLPQSS